MGPAPQSDPIKRLNDLMNSSGYFFPAPRPDGGNVYGAAFVRDPSVIKGNEFPAIQGAQAYGKRMLEGATAARECAKSPDQKLATTCKEFVPKFCDRAKNAFELSQDETNWWRGNFATLQSDAPGLKPVKGPPKLIQQTRLVACGIDGIHVFHEDDVGGIPQIARSVAPENPKLTTAAPVAPRDASAIAAPVAAPNAVAGAVATAPLVTKTESTTKSETAKLDASTPAPKKERAKQSKAPPQTAPVRTAASPVPVRNAGPVASQKPRTQGTQIAAVSPDSKAVKSRIEWREREATPTPAPQRSAMTGTFAGQLFGYAGGHIFSTDLIMTLVGAGKEVKGAWTSEQGKSGKVTGTLAGSGSSISSLRLEQLAPCAGTYAGSAVIIEDGQRLHGSYTGTDCKGQVDVSFIVVKH